MQVLVVAWVSIMKIVNVPVGCPFRQALPQIYTTFILVAEGVQQGGYLECLK
jgi:hypothetical protein